MDMKFLAPHRYRVVGWILALPSAVIMILALYWEFGFAFLQYTAKTVGIDYFRETTLLHLTNHNFTGDIASILLIAGLLMIAFSREKVEDERTVRLRLESLVWAVYVNSALILLSIVICYGTLFLEVMVYNICSTLILFIGRYHWVMYAERQHLKPEVA